MEDYVEKFRQADALAQNILRLTRNTLLVNLRFLDLALSQFQLTSYPGTLATDGQHLFYDTYYVLSMYKRERGRNVRDYLHIVLHCVFRHLFTSANIDRRCWDLACDIAVESAILAGEGTVIAVEYNQQDRQTMEENAHKFGLNNIAIIDHVDDASLSGLPVPTLTFLVASASLEQELQCLLRRNPHMEFVIYTLDFRCAASLPALFEQYGIGETEVIQIAVSKLGGKNTFTQEPAPWVISGRA